MASKSPRRRELIAQLGFPYDIVDVDVDEHITAPIPCAEVGESLACRKAAAYSSTNMRPDDVLVAADTVVSVDADVLGKPNTRAEAIGMLNRLQGRSHVVYTGVCLRTTAIQHSFTEATTVHFHPLEQKVIEYYVDTFRPYDKAGAYGIQEWIGMVGVRGIEGCYYNVMGLPVARIYHELQQMRIS